MWIKARGREWLRGGSTSREGERNRYPPRDKPVSPTGPVDLQSFWGNFIRGLDFLDPNNVAFRGGVPRFRSLFPVPFLHLEHSSLSLSLSFLCPLSFPSPTLLYSPLEPFRMSRTALHISNPPPQAHHDDKTTRLPLGSDHRPRRRAHSLGNHGSHPPHNHNNSRTPPRQRLLQQWRST